MGPELLHFLMISFKLQKNHRIIRYVLADLFLNLDEILTNLFYLTYYQVAQYFEVSFMLRD